MPICTRRAESSGRGCGLNDGPRAFEPRKASRPPTTTSAAPAPVVTAPTVPTQEGSGTPARAMRTMNTTCRTTQPSPRRPRSGMCMRAWWHGRRGNAVDVHIGSPPLVRGWNVDNLANGPNLVDNRHRHALPAAAKVGLARRGLAPDPEPQGEGETSGWLASNGLPAERRWSGGFFGRFVAPDHSRVGTASTLKPAST